MIMTEYYKEKLKQGQEYQDYIYRKINHILNINIVECKTMFEQYNIGENLFGMEIKFDNLYKKYGNLFIETAEKTKPENPNWIPSGIERGDNSWLYLQGDYKVCYIFGKKTLKRLNENLDKLEGASRKETPTSQGFTIPKKYAEQYAEKVIELENIN